MKRIAKFLVCYCVFAATSAALFLTFAHAADVSLCKGELVCRTGAVVPPTDIQCLDGKWYPAGTTCPTKCTDGSWVTPPATCPVVPPIIPPVGDISCPGFGKTIVLKMNWDSPERMYTKDFGQMMINDAVVVVFKTGSVTSPTNNLPRVSAAEWSSTPSTRIAVLSAKPCDWNAQAFQGATVSATSVTVPFTVNNPVNYGFYPILDLNTTYYFNVKNDPNSGCAVAGVCNIASDLVPVRADRAQDASAAKINAADQAYAKAAQNAAKAQKAVVPASTINVARAKVKKTGVAK